MKHRVQTIRKIKKTVKHMLVTYRNIVVVQHRQYLQKRLVWLVETVESIHVACARVNAIGEGVQFRVTIIGH